MNVNAILYKEFQIGMSRNLRYIIIPYDNLCKFIDWMVFENTFPYYYTGIVVEKCIININICTRYKL